MIVLDAAGRALLTQQAAMLVTQADECREALVEGLMDLGFDQELIERTVVLVRAMEGLAFERGRALGLMDMADALETGLKAGA